MQNSRTEDTYRDLRVDKPGRDYKLKCVEVLIPGKSETRDDQCGEDAHVTTSNFDRRGWAGKAWCDKHDPRKPTIATLVDQATEMQILLGKQRDEIERLRSGLARIAEGAFVDASAMANDILRGEIVT